MIVAPVFVNGTGVVREMARKGAHVVAVDSNVMAPGLHSRYAAERAILPSPGTDEGAFTEFLLARKDLYGGLVIPTDDFHLRELYERREELQPRYTLCISRGEAVRIALHKDLTEKAALEAGVDVPRSAPLESENDIPQAAKAVGFPAIVKPVFSISFNRAFQTKAFTVRDENELHEAFRKAKGAAQKVILQEIIPGGDEMMAAHISYWSGSGRCVGDYVFRKTLQFPPVFGVGQVVTVVRAPAVARSSRRILEHLGYAGAVAATEFKLDRRDGRWKLVDINTRTPMQSALARPAGCDVLEMLWRDKLGLAPPEPRPIRYGLRWVYIKDGILRYRGYPEHRCPVTTYLEYLRPPVVFGLLSARDPMPFVVDIKPVLKRRIVRQA